MRTSDHALPTELNRPHKRPSALVHHLSDPLGFDFSSNAIGWMGLVQRIQLALPNKGQRDVFLVCGSVSVFFSLGFSMQG